MNTTKILFRFTNDNCITNDEMRHTPLTFAGVNGHVAVVRVLLEGGANIESVNGYGSTALHCAAYNGYLNVCRILLDWGAKVNPVDVWGETPLHDAASSGHLSVVKLLVERGADGRVKDNKGRTAGVTARSEKKEDVAEWLDWKAKG